MTMSLFARTRSLVRNLVRRSDVDRTLDAELRAYLHLLEDEYVGRGMAPEAARRAARVELGGAEQVKAQVRDARTGALLEALVQDVRYAGRTLRRAPAFTAVTIATLALGIGANTAVFSIVDALLLRPLPIADPDRVVALYRGTTGSNSAFSYLDYLDYRAETRYFDGVAAWGGGNRAWFRNGGDLERVDVQMVSGNYFDVLGVGAPAGRTFTAADDDFAAPKAVAVISDGLWRTKFGADPAVAGRAFTLSGQTFTVIGRAPAGFTGMSADAPPNLWVPCAAVSLLEPGWNIRDRREVWMSIAARLRPGSDLHEAQASLQPLAGRIGLEQQGDAGARVRLIPASASVFDPDARASSMRVGALLMGIVGFVLLIACANVASLVLARGAARARELGVRLAIGASRGRVVRQVVTESLVLALAGGAAGLVVANWTAQLLVTLAPPDAVPPGLAIALDVRVMAFTTLLSLSTGVLFGAAPAWQLSRADPVAAIKDGGRADRSGGRAAVRMRRAAVVAQIALSIVLLVAAALFVRTLAAATAVPSGYDAGQVLLVTIDFSAAGAGPAGSLGPASRIVDRVLALPGVESASFGQIVPFSGSLIQRPAVPEGTPSTDDDMVPYNVVGEDYFRTLGMRLRGRDFRPADTEAAPRVVVINETLARRLWPGEEAIGRRLQLPLRNPGPPYEVIGVVSDGRYSQPDRGAAPVSVPPAGAERQAAADAPPADDWFAGGVRHTGAKRRPLGVGRSAGLQCGHARRICGTLAGPRAVDRAAAHGVRRHGSADRGRGPLRNPRLRRGAPHARNGRAHGARGALIGPGADGRAAECRARRRRALRGRGMRAAGHAPGQGLPLRRRPHGSGGVCGRGDHPLRGGARRDQRAGSPGDAHRSAHRPPQRVAGAGKRTRPSGRLPGTAFLVDNERGAARGLPTMPSSRHR